jgi:hypothetical protein
MSYMELTVSVGRAIVQDESWFIFARLPDLTIQVHGFPRLEPIRLTLSQISLHRKVSLRQV